MSESALGGSPIDKQIRMLVLDGFNKGERLTVEQIERRLYKFTWIGKGLNAAQKAADYVWPKFHIQRDIRSQIRAAFQGLKITVSRKDGVPVRIRMFEGIRANGHCTYVASKALTEGELRVILTQRRRRARTEVNLRDFYEVLLSKMIALTAPTAGAVWDDAVSAFREMELVEA